MSGLEKQFPGKVTASNVDATTPSSVEIVKQLGFGRHGLVVRGPDGEVLLAQPDHSVDIATVEAALNKLLGGDQARLLVGVGAYRKATTRTDL